MPAAPCDDDHNPAVGATFRAKRLSRWSRDATLMTRTTFYVRTRMLMTQETGVGWSTCGEVGCIGIRLDASWTCLAHATEEERAAALKLVGETGAIDARGVPVTATLLEQVLTVVPRGASGQPHIKNCWFDRATFTGNASFDRATFTGKSSFDRATFAGNAASRRRPLLATLGSTGRPSPGSFISSRPLSPATLGLTGRPSPAPPSLSNPRSAATPASKGRPSQAVPGSTKRPLAA